jgi:CDP-diacylglycerol--glycerol-3-phosphate 3-phosphatidyltransferase
MKVVPNIISFFRICLVPIFILAYFYDTRDIKLYAVFIYALATFSDFLDGFLARKFKASSNLGKFLDPLGDKLMTFFAFLCMTISGPIPVWAVLVVGIKEVLMAIGGFVVHKVANVEIPPSNLIGKTSTVVFFLVCVTIMLFKDLPLEATIWMICGAIVLMFAALASYVHTYVKVMKNRKKFRRVT